MPIINITNLTFAYDGSYDNIFQDVSFQLDTDWKTGFVGRNGRGKTTFLNLLLGKYDHGGSISASVKFGYFPFNVPDKTQNTVDVIESISTAPLWQVKKEIFMLDVFEDVFYRPFNTLSNGEQTKILLAALFLNDNNFLLIDEPTNHLDKAAREVVSGYLQSKKGFILVSHDRDFLDKSIDHVLSINKTNIEVQRGNFSSWWANKRRQDGHELAENEKLKKEIKQLEFAARQTSSWSDKVEKTKIGNKVAGLRPDRGYIGHKAAKMMKRSKVLESRQRSSIEEKSQLLRNIESSEDLKLSQIKYHTDHMLGFKDVSLFYGDKKVCEKITFEVARGERIALCGKNGSGKSTILKLICGNETLYTGAFEKGSQLTVSYVSQDTSFLSGGLSEYAEQNNIDESLFKAILRKLDFERVQFEKNIQDFSGGQKKKVLIARSLCEKAHLLVWDEPLNFVDIFSRMQIENLLLEYKPTIIFVEHDTTFSKKVATKTVLLA